MEDKKESRYQEVDISEIYDRKQYSSLCIPDFNQSYSLCLEYIINWFKKEFNQLDPNFFKSEYLEGQHMFAAFREFSKKEALKRLKPSLAITPSIDMTFDRDRLDMYLGGIHTYLNTLRNKNCFFTDNVRKANIGIELACMLVNFNFKVRVSTMAQALNTVAFMKLAFRVGLTQGHYISMDCHVPYELMQQVAKDCGFKIDENGDIVDIVGFMYYLNKNSQLPFLYKLRESCGKYEFFIRLDNVYVHISVPDISSDNGERDGQIMTNFIIEMNAAVRFPTPKFYAYYSFNKHTNIMVQSNLGEIKSYTMDFGIVPPINEKGWDQFATTQYEYTNDATTSDICFKEILAGDLIDIINYTKEMFLSPELFMQFKVYNDFKSQEIEIDWVNYLIKFKHPENIKTKCMYISIYLDKNYLNTQLINIRKLKESRLS